MAENLSQEEINQLLYGNVTDASADANSDDLQLSDLEKDTVGEIGNISMGTAATTLFALLGQKVTITTPKVSQSSLKDLNNRFSDPCVTISIGYKTGLEGTNLLIINEKDVKIITDLMMGGDGSNSDGELTELHLSAICEAMNQMIGSASTSMSELVGSKVDIEPPQAFYDSLDNLTEDKIGLNPEQNLAIIAFRMTVGSLIDSEIMQIMPIDMAKSLSGLLNTDYNSDPVEEYKAPATSTQTHTREPERAYEPERRPEPVYAPTQPSNARDAEYNYDERARRERRRPEYPPRYHQESEYDREPIVAQRAEFDEFDKEYAYYDERIASEIELIKDVPLEITVELGRTVKKIHEILDFSVGTVVELDRLVGESLDIFANGKKIAKGEVVVVDENYGVRITEIILPEDRLK